MPWWPSTLHQVLQRLSAAFSGPCSSATCQQGAGRFVFLPEEPGAQVGTVEWRADHTDVHDLIGGNIHDQLTEQILRVGEQLQLSQSVKAASALAAPLLAVFGYDPGPVV